MSYLWIFASFYSPLPPFIFPLFFSLLLLSPQELSFSSSIAPFFLSTGFLLFLILFILWAVVVVVLVLDLSLGGSH